MNQYKQLVADRLWWLRCCWPPVWRQGLGLELQLVVRRVGGGQDRPRESPTRTITLGLLTDLSGVFAPLAGPITQATQLFWDEQNAKGGVCGRKVKLVVKDHGYDPQKAVVQYRDMATQRRRRSSSCSARRSPQRCCRTLKTDRMLSLLAAWPSSLLANDFIIEIGAPVRHRGDQRRSTTSRTKGKIKSGDKIGHVYFEGEYGENGLVGSKYLGEKNGMHGRRAEDPADRRGHDRPGRRAQACGRQGDRR